MKALPTLLAASALATVAGAQTVHLNEIYASHSGTDDQEYIELIGTPGMSLDGIVVGIVEGDAGSSCAFCLDRAWDLSGMVMPASGYFVLGNSGVTPLDLDIGASNIIENGTETFYLISTNDPAAILALVGTTVDAGGGQSILPNFGTILDAVGMTDGGASDVVFDGAPAVGPDGSFLPAGIYRGGDWPSCWCFDAFLDFDDVANADQPRTPGAPNSACAESVAINELYVSHAGSDDQEYVELIGPAGKSLDGYLVLVIEGDGSSAFGTADRVWDLTGTTIPASGYFMLADTAVVPNDFDLGASNAIENGTETFLLVRSDDPAAVSALLGTDVDSDDDGNTDLAALAGVCVSTVDAVGMTDGGSGDIVYDGAPAVGPDGSFLPAGIYRGGDWPNDWCLTAFLDFDDVANAYVPRTPGAMNMPCVTPPTTFCFGDGSGTPCPCGNDAPGQTGCLNRNGLGCELSVDGFNAVSFDTVVLSAADAIPNDFGLYVQADNIIPPPPFGDGLRCVGFNMIRLELVVSDATGASSTSVSISAAGGVAAGDVKEYQFWYRDNANLGPCQSGFNTSNGVEIVWGP